MENYEEFIKKIKKVSNTRQHKIHNSYGVYDAFKYYRKTKPSLKKYVLKDSIYYKIIRLTNKKLIESFITGEVIKLPNQMGSIELRKHLIEPKFDEQGNFIYKAPVDWQATLNLWYEHENARKNKLLVKSEIRELFKIVYSKVKAKYNNKSFVLFKPNRKLKELLAHEAHAGHIDSFQT